MPIKPFLLKQFVSQSLHDKEEIIYMFRTSDLVLKRNVVTEFYRANVPIVTVYYCLPF